MVAVIPAYQPDEKLRGVVDSLLEKTGYAELIVDDGSRKHHYPWCFCRQHRRTGL